MISIESRLGQLKLIVTELNSFLEAKLVIGGSWAMFLHGLEPLPTVKDEVDLVVSSNLSQKDRQTLATLAAANPLYQFNEKYGWLVKYQFIFKGWAIDIFEESVSEETFFWYPKAFTNHSILVNPVNKIISARLKMGRKKDYLNIGKLITYILNLK